MANIPPYDAKTPLSRKNFAMRAIYVLAAQVHCSHVKGRESTSNDLLLATELKENYDVALMLSIILYKT